MKAEIKELFNYQTNNTECVALIKEEDKVILTISLERNPELMGLINLLDQHKLIEKEVMAIDQSESRLKQQRERMGLTLEEVAQLVGVSRQTISKIESGISEPKLGLGIKLADALKMDIRDILK